MLQILLLKKFENEKPQWIDFRMRMKITMPSVYFVPLVFPIGQVHLTPCISISSFKNTYNSILSLHD